MANNNQRINHGTAPPETGSAPHSYFDIAQNGVSQLIELQREQQRTLCSYIEFLQASLLGTSSTAEKSSVVSAVRAPAPAHTVTSAETPQRAVLASVPPTPALPTQVSIAASAAEPPASSGEARSPQVNVPAPIVSTSSVAVSEAGRSSSPALAPTAKFMAKLLGAVSQRTGYPEEMLNLDAHLEADLGIDSIKRIEIFSALKESGALKDLMEGDDEETVLEQLSALKTLREISAWYERLGKTVQLDKGAQPPKKASTPLSLS